ncbi:biopolymer transport protein ExbD [Yoonia maricola]|uniref:Biopolymer transport protein ExbD n=1 Tax=Yoonia maricola TaxID=420999 RepID=A0A2M8VZY3_9RHOB|nr:biopolymer transporter ExbD [Yoonia maricola]PJI84232.1 biopolymer transport protein ExbD [Yoonia maricola]
MSLERSKLPPARQRIQIDSSLAIVNIVLLLIFFFLTTGSMSNSASIPVQLPDTSELPLDLLPQPLLSVDADGAMMLNGEPIAPGTLAAAMIDEPTIHLLADRNANAGALLDMLAAEELIAVEVRMVTLHRVQQDGT